MSTYEITLNPGDNKIIVLTVEPYEIFETTYIITVRATSTANPSVNDSINTYTNVIINNRTIDVTTNKPIYDSGELIKLSIINIADVEIEGNPSFEVYNKYNDLVYSCYPDCWITLLPGENFSDIWIPNLAQNMYRVEGFFFF